jgi:hypothetical protein
MPLAPVAPCAPVDAVADDPDRFWAASLRLVELARRRIGGERRIRERCDPAARRAATDTAPIPRPPMLTSSARGGPTAGGAAAGGPTP